MPRCELDHLVVAAETLEAGCHAIERRLGVRAVVGGRHAAMGTHNCLVRLGERLYLEIIATDPAAPAPGRPRWFGLDSPETRERLRERPRLVAWVAGTEDLEGAVGVDPLRFGHICAMTRGNYSWRIAVRADGTVPAEGALPMLISWSVPAHPAGQLPESGCALAGLEHRTARAGAFLPILAALGLRNAIDIVPAEPGERPALSAHIATPRGMVRID